MTMVVFVGPTLRPEEVTSSAPGAVCLPPVAQGDVYRAVREGASTIGIVDGYFSGAPSVWHKEILWALAEGIPVFGSASMGALRAAELHDFGMRGVGRIFEAYRDGLLEDDDEVAVVHGPAETGFMVASEPMVNIRATLERAEAGGVISRTTRTRLEEAGKALFFPHRSWPAVLRAVGGEGEGLADFEKWLPEGAVDRKREDALEMLAAMQDGVADRTPFADFRFERTHFWDDLVERTGNAGPQSDFAAGLPQRIIDELRLLGPDIYREAARNALLRLLAEREADRRGWSVSPESKSAAATEMRRTLGLFSRSQLEVWIDANDLDERSYERLVGSEADCRAVTAAIDRRLLEQYLLDELRLSGQYEQLAERARAKAEGVDRGAELSAPSLPNQAQLRAWFFERRLGRTIPEDVASFAASLGFSTLAELDSALQQEFVYTRLGRGPGSPDSVADGDLPR